MSLWTWFAGVPSQEEQDAQLAAKKAAFEADIKAHEDAGTVTPERAQSLREYLAETQNEDVGAAAQAGFVEGLKEGADNVLTAPGKLVSAATQAANEAATGVVYGFFKNLPWWIYFGAAVALFIWMGGLALLKGSFAK